MKNRSFILTLVALVLSGYSVNTYAEDKIENFDDCNPNINPDCRIVASKTDNKTEEATEDKIKNTDNSK